MLLRACACVAGSAAVVASLGSVSAGPLMEGEPPIPPASLPSCHPHHAFPAAAALVSGLSFLWNEHHRHPLLISRWSSLSSPSSSSLVPSPCLCLCLCLPDLSVCVCRRRLVPWMPVWDLEARGPSWKVSCPLASFVCSADLLLLLQLASRWIAGSSGSLVAGSFAWNEHHPHPAFIPSSHAIITFINRFHLHACLPLCLFPDMLFPFLESFFLHLHLHPLHPRWIVAGRWIAGVLSLCE